MTTTHRALTFLGTLTAGAMIAASTITVAHADPTDNGTGSGGAPIGEIGIRDAGAPIGEIGTGAPDHSTPITIPDVTAKPGDPDYARQVQERANAQALEWARLQAIAAQQAPTANDEGE